MKTILVVGANGGVGHAVVRCALAVGHRVIATVSRPEKRATFEAEHPGCAQVFALDLGDAETAGAALRRLVSDHPDLSGVIVCAATTVYAPAESLGIGEFHHVLEVNTIAPLVIYQATLPTLRRNRGRLIFTGSLSGRVGSPLMAAYVASKFALEGLVDVMRQEAGMFGVEIILLQPGTIDTPMVSRCRDDVAAAADHLAPHEAALYEPLYRQMQGRASAALAQYHRDGTGMVSPDKVAQIALAVLEVQRPEPRYRIGADAESMIEVSRTRPDREIDAMILGAYAASIA